MMLINLNEKIVIVFLMFCDLKLIGESSGGLSKVYHIVALEQRYQNRV